MPNFHFAEEEFPMTMQVAMVGTDGIVLASDTNWSRIGGDVRHTHGRTKIKMDSERRIAISFARSMEVSEPIADRIMATLSNEEWRSPERPIANAAREIIEQSTRDDVELLIVTATPALRLFRLEVSRDPNQGQERTPVCYEVSGKAFAGDTENSAVFWAERYAKGKTIQFLIPLAAHLVISAGNLNSGAISGLEIVVCKSHDFSRIPDESIAKLEAAARQREIDVENLFGEWIDKDH